MTMRIIFSGSSTPEAAKIKENTRKIIRNTLQLHGPIIHYGKLDNETN